MNIILDVVLIVSLIKIFFSSSLPNSTPEEEKPEHPDTSNQSIDFSSNKSTFSNSKKNFKQILLGYYSNYPQLSLRFHEMEIWFKKGWITETNARWMWEYLLNIKTERNTELMDYNKSDLKPILTPDDKGNKVQKYLSILFNTDEFNCQSLNTYMGCFWFYLVVRFLLKYPKVNLILCLMLMIINIWNSFYFYNKKYYCTSSVCLCCGWSNIYFVYWNIAILAEEREMDCSMFYVKHFKTQTHFYLKIGISFFLLFTLVYLASVSLRFHLNYIVSFFILEKIKEMIINYFRLTCNSSTQPWYCFISIVFGSVLFAYTTFYYYLNLPFSYEWNSFLFVNYSIALYYALSLNKYIYIHKYKLIDFYIECEKINDEIIRKSWYNEFQNHVNIEKYFRTLNLGDVWGIDVFLILTLCCFLSAGVLLTSYVFFYLAWIILFVICNNCLIFYRIKISRILSNVLYLMFIVSLSNLSCFPYHYINEVIAFSDKKWLDAISQLIKWLIYISLGCIVHLNEEFIDWFNFYNYSTCHTVKRELLSWQKLQFMDVVKEVYTWRTVLQEILFFNLNEAMNNVHLVFNEIDETSSNINELYIETFLEQAASSANLPWLLTDFFTCYITLFYLNSIFSSASNTLIAFVHWFHKLGLFGKIAFWYFEYSKSDLQNYVYILINIVFLERFSNCPDHTLFEVTIINWLKIWYYILYLFIMNNSNFMNAFFVLYFWIYYNSHLEALFGLPIVLSTIWGKITTYFLNWKKWNSMVYLFYSLLLLVLFSFLNFETWRWFNFKVRYWIVKFTGVDVWYLVEKFMFIKKERNEYFEIAVVNRINIFINSIKLFE